MRGGERFEGLLADAREALGAAVRSVFTGARAGGCEVPEGVEDGASRDAVLRADHALRLAVWAGFRAGCDGDDVGRFDALARLAAEDVCEAVAECLAGVAGLPEGFGERAVASAGRRAGRALLDAAAVAYAAGADPPLDPAVHERPTIPP